MVYNVIIENSFEVLLMYDMNIHLRSYTDHTIIFTDLHIIGSLDLRFHGNGYWPDIVSPVLVRAQGREFGL